MRRVPTSSVASAGGRRFSASLAVSAAIASLGWGYLAACNQCQDVCPQPFNVLAYCFQEGGCLLSGQPVPLCTPGTCGSFFVPAGGVLTVPAGALATKGSRDDLHIWPISAHVPSGADGGAADGGANAYVKVLVDGTPFPGCGLSASDGTVVCANLPAHASALDLQFVEEASGLQIDLHDDECEAAHPPCPL